MSVTFFIDNNETYVDSNCPEHIRETVYDCQCAEFNPEPNPDCRECAGTGKVTFRNYPFELNLSNTNFCTLMNALGFDFDCFGEIDPRRMLKALNRIPSGLVCREASQEGNHLYAGICPEQADRYFRTLTEIASEAERREEKILWG